MTKIRVLSGMRPTSQLHLGNLLGAIETFKRFENEDAYYMIADLHALTTEYDSKKAVREIVLEVVTDYLASGLDPERCTLFVQSWVPEHAQLSLLLSMITPIPWLERNPSYKELLGELRDKDIQTHGFLGYPVLQAADIMLYKADTVPVGEDQLPHLELAREIARRFNRLYGPLFPEPKAALSSVPRLPGLDGRKMSKSYGNCIYLSDAPQEVERKVRSMVTDPARVRREDPGHPEVCPVFFYQKIFSPREVPRIDRDCRSAVLGCVEDKEDLAKKIISNLAPIYEKRKQLEKKRTFVWDVLKAGTDRAQKVARATFEEAREAMGI